MIHCWQKVCIFASAIKLTTNYITIYKVNAQISLAEIQKSGYFSDLQIYLKEDNKAFRIDEA